jgi:Domain of unknown function (DUF4440)
LPAEQPRRRALLQQLRRSAGEDADPARGPQVTKKQYLEGLQDPDNTYELLESKEIETIVFDKCTALVSLQVEARGTRSGNPFEGSYRNTRLFVKERGSWRCAVWFNSRES